MTNIEKRYNPQEVEDKIYKYWMDGGFFRAEVDKNKAPYTIVIPPPNVTSHLHMGHALDNTLQDILIRLKRMQGYSALWLPGTDHAGIATQIKVEEELRTKEGKTRHDIGREKFLERVWEWKNLYGSKIINQLKRLGSSCDWNRERFTMDADYSKAVREVFVNLYNKGLIYQGHRIINWCPCCTTALSDAEVEHSEHEGNFWHIKYPVKDSSEFVVIATTRPETLLGDTAVAVSADDERYKHLIRKMLILPLVEREIPIIADEHADAELGTGAVKITPAHDPNDFEVGLRHNLPQIRVMNDNGTINELGGKYNGMDRYDARRAIVADLEALNLLVKIEPKSHNIGKCYRCNTIVEPITSNQWFVKMSPLAKESIDVVQNGDIKFVPGRFEKTYIHWMENVYDWCISRQLWWGHRIPAFYCKSCGKTTVSKTDITQCPDCGHDVRQDEDVLDTWFSSALWPFATLGWPEKTADLDYFYPTSTLVTGYDIIFFWVARMIFSGMEHMGEKPFDTVFLHGLIRDSQGRKMSKSLGNGIDPNEIIDEYGADALRLTLATGNAPGNDMRFYVERVEASRNFANKLWNAARFVLMNLPEDMEDVASLPDNLEPEDKWIISLYNSLVAEVTENLDKFELGIAVQKLYDFIWDEFCDWYIEMVKPRLSESNTLRVLVYVLSNTLKLLHPFMPFITEEIYQHLPLGSGSIMVSQFPKYDANLHFPEEAREVAALKDAIRAIRNVRAEMNVPPSKKAQLVIITNQAELFEIKVTMLQKMAFASEVLVNKPTPPNAVSVVTADAEIFMPQGDLIDFEKDLQRLTKEKEKIEGEIARAESKLSNQGFIAKAPESLIAVEKEKLATFIEMKEKILEQIKNYEL